MAPEMLQVAVRAVAGTLLFRTNDEALALWRQIVGRVRPYALVLMPDHLHAMLQGLEQWLRMRTGLRAFALQRNRLRGASGPVFEHDVAPQPVPRDRWGRSRRYIHLNPCRTRPPLACDPLASDFSSHRDVVGFAIPGVCTPARDAAAFHRFVSADPSVRVDGTLLPARPSEVDGAAGWDAIRAAVSAVTRTPASLLAHDRTPRLLLVHAARDFGRLTVPQIGDHLEVARATIYRDLAAPAPGLSIVQSVIGDPRFALLRDGDLTGSPAWQRYRHLR